MKYIGLFLFLFFSFNCATAQKETVKKGEEKVSQNEVIAKVNGKEITDKELEDFLGIALMMKHQEIFQLKRAALQDFIFIKLQEEKAKAENLTLDQYYEKYVINVAPDPSDEEVNNFYEQNKARIGNLGEEDAKKQIKNYLKSQKIQESENALKEKLLKEAKIETMLKAPKMDLSKGNEPIKGKVGAPITIIEFTDFQCPYCSRAQSTIEKIFSEYPEKVQLIFKDFPLEFHKQAKDAHIAAQCANEQGKFWEYHDILFKNQNQLFLDKLNEYAKQLNLDMEKFSQCVNTRKYEKYVNESIEQAQNLGITGTPTFFVNGRIVKGAQPFETFKQIIEEELSFATQSSGN